MRNLSMKKFGTPIGAGPSGATVKPGADGVGAAPVWVCVVVVVEPLASWSVPWPPRADCVVVGGMATAEPEVSPLG